MHQKNTSKGPSAWQQQRRDEQWEMQTPAVQAVTPYHIHGENDLAFLAEYEALGFALLLLRLGRVLN